MRDILEILIRVQEAENKIQEIKRKNKSIPESINALQKEVEELKKAKEKFHDELKKQELKLRELEVDLKEIQEKIRAFQEKARQVKSNEEFRAMQAQIEHAGIEKIRKEEEIFAQMELVESLKKELPVKSSQIEAELSQKEAELKNLQTELQKLTDELAENEKIKEALLQELPEKEKALFLKLYSKLGPYVVCPVLKYSNSKNEVEYACSGCNSIIPLAFVQDLKLKGGYSRCPNCGRIVYYSESENEKM